MPHTKDQISDPATGVNRACQIAKNFFQAARGNYETDQQTVEAISRQSRLTPAVFRRFIQPSRRPKDVSLTVWQRMLGGYRRYLERELARLQDEIARLEALDPDDRAVEDLLHKARALVVEVEAALPPVPSRSDRAE